VREHVQDDPAAVFRAVVPGGALRGSPSLEHPVAELEPDREHPAEEPSRTSPAQLDHAGQEKLVLDDAVGDAAARAAPARAKAAAAEAATGFSV